jgi:hypothetical protein
VSEPKRYWMDDQNDADFPYEAVDGEWVKWENYARLKAEVERLTDCQSEADRLKAEVEAHEKRWAESEDLISHYKQQRDEAYNDCQCHRLKAEVERLRKAGDAMYESKIGYYGEQILEDMKHHSGELCRNWNAAKEGKPSV